MLQSEVSQAKTAARPRPLRQPMLRVRTGCFTCRSRKKKCDETKPACSGCKRNKLVCNWPARGGETSNQRVEVTSTHNNNIRRLDDANSNSGSSTNRSVSDGDQDQERQNLSPTNAERDHHSTEMEEGPAVRRSSTSTTASPPVVSQMQGQYSFSPGSDTSGVLASPFERRMSMQQSSDNVEVAMEMMDEDEDIPDELLDLHVDDDDDERDNDNALMSLADIDMSGLLPGFMLMGAVPRPPSMIPEAENGTFDLMSHYLARTAVSMGNGSTSSNPFVLQLVPLSFSNKLVLQLVLSQSAAHRAVYEERRDLKAVAQRYYTNSIRSFRQAISAYINGSDPSPLWVTIGALVMCFTETARGDTNGVVFDHLQAVEPLSVDLITNHNHIVRDDLKKFIIEYYVYTVTISMISASPASRNAPLLNPTLELEAHNLVASGYIGQLCGCWLQLLLLIPRIFEFGRRTIGGAVDVDSSFPSPDDFIAFATLRAEILSYTPNSDATKEVILCGYMFQQALYLYLLTVFRNEATSGGLQRTSIDNAVSETFSYLEQLPPTARINTSLCWVLAVVGSCTLDGSRRDQLRRRLECMFQTIGLGNISSTLTLLEHIWTRPKSEQNPWAICRVMQEQEIWISFA
ncbi:fungal specific transcription factor domain-containing protein [Trichoderma breve]|uniref:Fungal specific transcription factor domain-containing protein n=1 Tax=Trichoderma breve TaxID=2034170 RepID=A0A9W9EF24_9HYPO|nr:fungal specific transcription factor domain-containing protein [Trichoderma breve]KAJ4865526.1 fungal specific transcription factor domain-containing protein [Trichoderma breve]